MIEQDRARISVAPFPPLTSLSTVTHPLVQISLSPQSFAAVKIKDISYNFHQENTEH